MTDEAARIVQELRRQAGKVTSFTANYRSTSNLFLVSIEATGMIFFLSPDRCRAESSANGKQVTTIRKGSVVQRCLPQRNEIWRYDLADLPQSEPINFAVADFMDPFFAVDELTLRHEGREQLSDIWTQVFTGKARNWSKQGLLDTRKGFSITYQPKYPQFNLKLYIDSKTGMLRRIVGTDTSGKQVLQTDYLIDAINIPLSEGLFTMDESTAKYKVIQFTDIMLASLNPDSAEAPPSIN